MLLTPHRRCRRASIVCSSARGCRSTQRVPIGPCPNTRRPGLLVGRDRGAYSSLMISPPVVTIGVSHMHTVICYPFLDLRFLIDPREAPSPPRWPSGSFGTVSSLGPVVAEARDGGEAEIRANAAILFPSEYKRAPKPRVRRCQESPAIGNRTIVSGRRLLADTNGQVLVEITLCAQTEKPGALGELLDTLFASPVEVVLSGQT